MKKAPSRRTYAVACAFVALFGITCTDGLTGPRSPKNGLTRVGFAPVFSQAGAEIFRNLEAFNYQVNNVHVNLAHQSGRAAKDTIVALAPGQDSIAIQMAVSLEAPEEDLSATIELRDQGTVLFSGKQKIAAKIGSTPPPPPPFPVEFTGPGAGATTFTITPKDTVATAGIFDTIAFQPTAKNGSGQTIPNAAVAWSVTDEARGIVLGNGKFTPFSNAARGTMYVIARLLNGLKDSSRVTVQLPATKLVVVSGGGQAGTVGKPLSQSIVVEARASDDVSVANLLVTFALGSGGGSLSRTQARTDANGRASVDLTLGTTAGLNSMTASASSGPLNFLVTIGANGTADKAAKLAVSQQPSTSAASGVALATQPKVQVQDTYGNSVSAANIPILASLTNPSGRTLNGKLAVSTDASGVAQFTDLAISGPPGPTTLTFTQDTLASATSSAIALTVGAPAAMSLEGSSQLTVVAGQSIPAASAILVADGGGNGVPNVDVLVQVFEGGEIIRFNQTLKTDASGRVPLNSIPLGTKAGLFVINGSNAALQGAGSPVTAAVTITHASASKLGFLQQPSNTASGAIISPAVMVQVQDDFNNLITTGPGATTTVDLSLTGGTPGAVLGPSPAALSQAAVSGIATFNVSVDKEGTGYTLNAKSAFPAITSDKFDITAVPLTIVAETSNYMRFNPNTVVNIGVKALNGGAPQPGLSVDFVDLRSACEFTKGTTAVTDASGIARVEVLLPPVLSSCQVQATPTGVQNPPLQQMAFLRVYAAPAGTPFWTGQTSTDWNTNSNWFGDLPPSPGGTAFIPAGWLGLDAIPVTPKGTTTLDSLVLESGATMTNAETLALNAMAVDGIITGGGTVVVDARSRSFRATMIQGLLRVGTNALAAVSGNVVADSIELNNELRLDQDVVVVTSGAFRTVGNGRVTQSQGLLEILGDATFTGGFSSLTDGGLLVGGNFTLNAAGCANDINATDPHVTQVTGSAKSIVDTVRFNWNGCEARLAKLDIASPKPVAFVGPPGEFLTLSTLIINEGSRAVIPASITLSLFQGSDRLMLLGPNSMLRIENLTSMPALTCMEGQTQRDLKVGDNFGPLSCSIP